MARRKATVVAAVDYGLIEPTEACSMYRLSDEELDLWRSAVRRHGAAALRVTAIQKYDNFKESCYLTDSRGR